MKIVIATNNSGKFNELKQMLDTPSVEFLPMSDFKIDSPEETGLSYVENAIIKARYVAEKVDMLAIADDSGLEINALNGFPGIKSARCAGDDATDEQKRNYILNRMKKEHDGTAVFICSLAFVDPSYTAIPSIFTGIADGEILEEPHGLSRPGLQYDSIFYYEPLKCTFAEMPEDVKNKVSHRADACALVREYINGIIKGRYLGFGNI